MTLDELLLEWSYRSDKGYPSMDNPSDISLLKEILEQLDLPTDDILNNLEGGNTPQKSTYANKDGKPGITSLEPSDYDEETPPEEEPESELEPEVEPEVEAEPEINTTDYDNLILETLGVDQIPRSKNTYTFKPGNFDEQVKSDDLKTWKALWNAKPPKKSGDKTPSLGVGKGEISLYWLYNYSKSSTAGKLAEGRGDDAPDLWFNGEGNEGVEVKAYGAFNSQIDLGRFGKFRDNLKMLNIIFGVRGLSAVFDGEVEDQKQVNALSWNGPKLAEAFEAVFLLKQVDLLQIANIWPIFEKFETNINYIDKALGGFADAKEGAEKMAFKFIGDKLARKPGWGGHLADMKLDGSIRFWHILEDKFRNYDGILEPATVGASQGAMKLHFNKIFG
jgi:hypothetical protein